jgi:hypothetical protein
MGLIFESVSQHTTMVSRTQVSHLSRPSRLYIAYGFQSKSMFFVIKLPNQHNISLLDKRIDN